MIGWKKIAALLLFAALSACGAAAAQQEDAQTHIALSDEGITVDGKAIVGDSSAAVYAARDIVFYLEGQGMTYGEGTEKDGHSQEEADAHTVVHITKPGTYRLSGTLSAGQIAVDLGKDAKKDEQAVVTLILDGVDITSTVAPSVIFYNVYECGSDDADTATKDVDTAAAGANVVIADGSVNTLNGSYVARIYDPESVVLSEDGKEVEEAKKLHKYDGTLYSKLTMNVRGGEKGDGVLNINAENEGLCSDLHLTIDGGVIHIASGNDGINASEDYVSVCAINGGEVNITVTGATGEGDGIDSNGWLLIGGGRVNASACAFSGDAGIDSDMGIYISGGEVVAGGKLLDHLAGAEQTYAVFEFASSMKGGTAVTLKDESGRTVGEYAPENDYRYLIAAGDAITAGTYTLWQGDTQLAGGAGEMMGRMPGGGFGGRMPADFDPAKMDRPEGMERMELPEDFDPAQMTPPGEMENMEPPKMPEGMQLPEGFDPEKFGGGRGFGGGFGGRGGRGGVQGEMSTAFVIEEGGSVFSGVSAAE